VTLEEGAEFEKQGLKWLNFNKYTGPIIPPRESKMIPSQSSSSAHSTPIQTTTTISTSNDSKTLAPPSYDSPMNSERKLSPEEQFRRSKVQIALKPDTRKEQKERLSKAPRSSAQTGQPKTVKKQEVLENKTNLVEQKIVESEEEEKAEKIAALQVQKEQLANELEILKQQAAQQLDTGLQGPPGT